MTQLRNYKNHIAKINNITEQNCKSKQEWLEDEIFYTKNKFYPVRHKSAEELQERINQGYITIKSQKTIS